MGCIKKWIKRLNNQDDHEEEKKFRPPPNANNRNRRDYNEDNEDEDYKRDNDAKEAAKKLIAFYTWTCPNCNYSYAENDLPKYSCFCKKYDEP